MARTPAWISRLAELGATGTGGDDADLHAPWPGPVPLQAVGGLDFPRLPAPGRRRPRRNRKRTRSGIPSSGSNFVSEHGQHSSPEPTRATFHSGSMPKACRNRSARTSHPVADAPDAEFPEVGQILADPGGRWPEASARCSGGDLHARPPQFLQHLRIHGSRLTVCRGYFPLSSGMNRMRCLWGGGAAGRALARRRAIRTKPRGVGSG